MKKRTHVKRAAKNPVFNESFILQLPPTNVKNVVMDVQVREHSSSLLNRKLLFPVESAIPVGLQRVSFQMMHHNGIHSECLGRVLLNESDIHVSDAVAAPDRQIAQWHSLE